MTPETTTKGTAQREARRQDRLRAREQREHDFPPSMLRRYENGAGIQIQLLPENPFSIFVSSRGKLPAVDLQHGWSELSVHLTIDNLAPFIHALICRYNAMVAEANHKTNITLEQLKEFQPGAPE